MSKGESRGAIYSLTLFTSKFFIVAQVLLVSVLLTSCEKQSIVGASVQPDRDMLGIDYIDTTSIIAKTFQSDSLRTDETITQEYTTHALIGTYLDPIFGKASASLYTQLRLNKDNPSFGTNPIVDSVVLVLMYDSYYGKDQIVAQNINVHQVTEAMNTTTDYYSSDSLTRSITDLANNYSFIAEPAKNYTVVTITQGDTIETILPPQLRIPLDSTFGQNILNKQGEADLASNDAFQSYLNGIFISTANTPGLSTNEGNIFRFKMEDAQTVLSIFYHNDTDTALNINFSFNSVARFASFNHDYSTANANLIAQLGASPPANNDDVFIQPSARTNVKIEFPYLMNWLDSGAIAINTAELEITVNNSAGNMVDTFPAPPQLIAYGINNDGTQYDLPDALEGLAYFGGIYDSTAYVYKINIARYVQQVLNGTLENNGLYLKGAFEAILPNRVVLGGGTGANKMKLNITRTEIP